MTQQFDMLGLPLDEATTRRFDLPRAREVRKPRLRDVLGEASAEPTPVEVNHGA
jgi:hypothetical protein